MDTSALLLDPALAPTLPFERPTAGYGSTYSALGALPALVELDAPAMGPASLGVQTNDITKFTQTGTLFVPRGAGTQAGDRVTYQGRKFLIMGAQNWDMNHPMTGDDFGWMTFAIEIDPVQIVADLLALRGQQITLTPATGVPTETASGGFNYAAASDRDPQLFVLFVTKGLDGREDSQTDRGLSRKFEYQLVGSAGVQIAIGDAWEDDVANYEVAEVDRSKPWVVEALVVGYLKIQGHGFG
jgi:hypothetical protein